jgi:hypothetical protein
LFEEVSGELLPAEHAKLNIQNSLKEARANIVIIL